jgi:predicted nucleic acid-binding protein
MLVADTNVLIGLFVPDTNSLVVQACREADDDWRLPSLWVPEFRHVLLKFLRVGRLDLSTA